MRPGVKTVAWILLVIIIPLIGSLTYYLVNGVGDRSRDVDVDQRRRPRPALSARRPPRSPRPRRTVDDEELSAVVHDPLDLGRLAPGRTTNRSFWLYDLVVRQRHRDHAVAGFAAAFTDDLRIPSAAAPACSSERSISRFVTRKTSSFFAIRSSRRSIDPPGDDPTARDTGPSANRVITVAVSSLRGRGFTHVHYIIRRGSVSRSPSPLCSALVLPASASATTSRFPVLRGQRDRELHRGRTIATTARHAAFVIVIGGHEEESFNGETSFSDVASVWASTRRRRERRRRCASIAARMPAQPAPTTGCPKESSPGTYRMGPRMETEGTRPAPVEERRPAPSTSTACGRRSRRLVAGHEARAADRDEDVPRVPGRHTAR